MKKQDLAKKYGPWALVTGASSGIGEQFARLVAANGLNVVLAARREARLVALAGELESQYGIETRVVAVDLSAADYLETIRSATDDIEIGLLVNNAGGGLPGAFLKQDLATRTLAVNLNVVAPMQLTYIFSQKMGARGRGGIIFVSSLAGYMGTPYMANYAATKAYVLHLGEGLHIEMKSKGVDVLVLSPGATRTEIANVEGMDTSTLPMPWMEADEVAAAALKALGNKSAIIPGRINNFMMFIMNHVMPRKLASAMFGSMLARSMSPEIL